jgi:hypothetical protein
MDHNIINGINEAYAGIKESHTIQENIEIDSPNVSETDTMSDLDAYNLVLEYLLDEGFASTEQSADKIILNMSEAWFDDIMELYKGKHGQSEKEYMDSRSDAGKQISGDSKMSGAAYSHRSFKGQGKPSKPGERQTAQGRMTNADRTELMIRKNALKKDAEAKALKKEELELDENRRAARSAGGYKDDSKKQPDPSKDGFTGIGNMSIDAIRKMSARIEKEKSKKDVKEGVRDDKTAERKARLEKKRGMKLDDHPEYKKEEVESVDEATYPSDFRNPDGSKRSVAKRKYGRPKQHDQETDRSGRRKTVDEETEDSLRDKRQERGGVDGNTRYDRAPKAPNTKKFGTGKTALQKEMEKKHGKGASAMDIVKAEMEKKYGKGAVMSPKKKEEKKED